MNDRGPGATPRALLAASGYADGTVMPSGPVPRS